MPTNTDIPFKIVVDALADTTTPFPNSYLTRFSDIRPNDLALLKETWPDIKIKRRLSLINDLNKFQESSTIVCFDDLAVFFLTDVDPRIRTAAIHLLRESEDPRLINRFLKILNEDKQVVVRAAAAGGLGMFVLLGELDKISEEKLSAIERALLPKIIGKEDDLIRRSALEAMGYSSRKEMEHYISEAFEESDPDWVASALVAMGRSASDEWELRILRSLFHPDVIVRLEAIRAAGVLSLTRALEPLLEMLDTGVGMTKELRFAAIWTLSELGGEKAGAALEALLDRAESDEESNYIDEAIENLNFGNDALDLGIIDIDSLRDANTFAFENNYENNGDDYEEEYNGAGDDELDESEESWEEE